MLLLWFTACMFVTKSSVFKIAGYWRRCWRLASSGVRGKLPGQEVLRLVPVGAGRGWCETDHAPGQESESERVCRALGSIRETGVPVKAGSVW